MIILTGSLFWSGRVLLFRVKLVFFFLVYQIFSIRVSKIFLPGGGKKPRFGPEAGLTVQTSIMLSIKKNTE